jgi:hypothetical protein
MDTLEKIWPQEISKDHESRRRYLGSRAGLGAVEGCHYGEGAPIVMQAGVHAIDGLDQ